MAEYYLSALPSRLDLITEQLSCAFGGISQISPFDAVRALYGQVNNNNLLGGRPTRQSVKDALHGLLVRLGLYGDHLTEEEEECHLRVALLDFETIWSRRSGWPLPAELPSE